VRFTTLLAGILGLKATRIVDAHFDFGCLVIDVRPKARQPYCGSCFKPVRRIYDQRAESRLWRHLDLAGVETHLRYRIRRVECRHCGVTTELVPWADPGQTRFTREFDERVAYLAQRTDQTTVSKLMRTSWATVGRVAERVVDRIGPSDWLDNLTHIAVDELSYRRHHEYVTVVMDHGLGRVVWAGPGRNADALKAFFTELGPERCRKIRAVTIDMSAAYIDAVRAVVPHATIVFDRFHVQRLAHDALNEVRRAQWRVCKGTERARVLKRTRFTLQKSPWNLDPTDRERLSAVAAENAPLYRAWLLKETLAGVLDRRQVHVAAQKLAEWLAWASRSKLKPFVKLARTIRKHRGGILEYVRTGLSNGRLEGLNGKIRVITRRAFGFHSAKSLIAFLRLCCGGLDLEPAFTSPNLLPLTR